MSIDLQTAKKLPVGEDRTQTVGFEQSVKNTVVVKRGHCPQCLEPMGMQNVQGKATIKVITAEGIEHWCESCFKKGEKKKICIKYRSLGKKERKAIRKTLKKEGKK